MIPKKIHYCWFGKKPLPNLAVKCIASWKKYCPDYEIIEWNEDNFDVCSCDYVKEAFEGVYYRLCPFKSSFRLWRNLYGYRCGSDTAAGFVFDREGIFRF